MAKNNKILKEGLKKSGENPGKISVVYDFVFFLVRLVFGSKPKPQFELNGFDKLEGPFVLLTNHESFNDFYYTYQLASKFKPLYVSNRYYCILPVLKQLNTKVGIIPKKIFCDDMVTPIRIVRAIKNGRSVIIFPEGRMSIDGRTNRITETGGAFYKRLGVPLVLVRINGAFYEKPKWRKRRYRTPVSVTVERIISKEEAALMSTEELNSVIENTIRNDAGAKLLCKYPQKDKAEGLHNILYRCCSCDGLYTVSSRGNSLSCSQCGRTFTLNEDYRFNEEPYTIAAWYDHMTEVEMKKIKDIKLNADVNVVIYSNTGKKRKEKARCTLTFDGFSYESSRVSFTYPMDTIQGLVFKSGAEFEFYYEDEMYYCYPEKDPVQVARWAHIVDIIKTMKERQDEE